MLHRACCCDPFISSLVASAYQSNGEYIEHHHSGTIRRITFPAGISYPEVRGLAYAADGSIHGQAYGYGGVYKHVWLPQSGFSMSDEVWQMEAWPFDVGAGETVCAGNDLAWAGLVGSTRAAYVRRGGTVSTYSWATSAPPAPFVRDNNTYLKSYTMEYRVRGGRNGTLYVVSVENCSDDTAYNASGYTQKRCSRITLFEFSSSGTVSTDILPWTTTTKWVVSSSEYLQPMNATNALLTKDGKLWLHIDKRDLGAQMGYRVNGVWIWHTALASGYKLVEGPSSSVYMSTRDYVGWTNQRTENYGVRKWSPATNTWTPITYSAVESSGYWSSNQRLGVTKWEVAIDDVGHVMIYVWVRRLIGGASAHYATLCYSDGSTDVINQTGYTALASYFASMPRR